MSHTIYSSIEKCCFLTALDQKVLQGINKPLEDSPSDETDMDENNPSTLPSPSPSNQPQDYSNDRKVISFYLRKKCKFYKDNKKCKFIHPKLCNQ